MGRGAGRVGRGEGGADPPFPPHLPGTPARRSSLVFSFFLWGVRIPCVETTDESLEWDETRLVALEILTPRLVRSSKVNTALSPLGVWRGGEERSFLLLAALSRDSLTY
jgi:hypothetical protein